MERRGLCALCFAALVALTAAGPLAPAQGEEFDGPSPAELAASHATTARIEATVAAHFPPLAEESLMSKAGRVAMLNSLQVLALQGVLEIGDLEAECTAAGGASPQPCAIEPARAVLPQLLALGDACPDALAARARMECLIEFQTSLAAMESLVYADIRQGPILENADLWRAWDRSGRPPPRIWSDIPELQEFSEIDAILLFTTYFKLRALEQMIVLSQRIAELATLGADAQMYGEVLAMGPRMGLPMVRTDLERLWTLEAYSMVTAGNWGLGEWLTNMRGMSDRIPSDSAPSRIPVQPVQADRGDEPASTVGAPPPDTDAANAAPATSSPAGSGTDQRPKIWVQNGQPIFLPGTAPAEPAATAPAGTGQSDGGKPSAPSGQAAPVPGVPAARGAPPHRWVYSRKLNWMLIEEAVWEALERSTSGKTVAQVRSSRALRRAVGGVIGAIGVGRRIAEGDVVGAYVATVEMVGGPLGVFLVEASGLEEKLTTLDEAGYDIPEVMNYCAENAQRLLNPFARANAPYSQMPAPTGPYERSTPSSEWLKQMRAEIEDAARRQ